MKHFLIVMFALTGSLAHADESSTSGLTPEVLEAFVPDVYDDEGFKLPYRLLSPEEASADDKRPLLVFFHGFGERGDNNEAQIVHGGKLFASPEFQARHRAYVLAPQCPAGNLPDSEMPVIWSQRLWPTKETPAVATDAPMSEPMQAARRLIDHLISDLPIDADRVYVCGLSMGGYATWEMAAREPDFWAAAAPICGGGNPAWGEQLAGLPLWAFHGDADGAVPVERSREMIAAINAAGGRAVYTEYPGEGHGSWNPTFQSQQVWDWLFAQRR